VHAGGDDRSPLAGLSGVMVLLPSLCISFFPACWQFSDFKHYPALLGIE